MQNSKRICAPKTLPRGSLVAMCSTTHSLAFEISSRRKISLFE